MATQAPHQSDGSIVYAGTCRPCAEPPFSAGVAAGTAARLYVPDRSIDFTDAIFGQRSVNLAHHCGDFVLRRADGAWAYQLAVVVDDALMGVTEVMRGCDLLLSSAQQIYLYGLLGYDAPEFAHLPLICNGSGVRLSKRDRGVSMADLLLCWGWWLIWRASSPTALPELSTSSSGYTIKNTYRVMIQLKFDKDIRAGAPALKVLQIECDVVCSDTSDALWNEIEECYAGIKEHTPIEEVRRRPAIAATREAYKACGKDPNRYRPSAEALCRRAVRGLELYRTLSVIDLINLLSMLTGHSIGGFDADKVVGPVLTLGVGAEGEPYEAIGRGELNIAGLPVYRDAVGGIGTPTSDNERTKLTPATRRLLVTINIYGDAPGYDTDAVESLARRLLTDYACADNIETHLYNLTDENT